MAITVSGVWKRYRLRSESLKEVVSSLLPRRRRRPPPRPKSLWALSDVSFRVERSSTFALVGANGSGKSTMLKLIAEMMKPTRGSIRVEGRLSLLSFLGGSFHGDLTGRENVFLEGALLGLSRQELRAKLDAIFDFAGLEEFIDVPVKFYSVRRAKNRHPLYAEPSVGGDWEFHGPWELMGSFEFDQSRDLTDDVSQEGLQKTTTAQLTLARRDMETIEAPDPKIGDVIWLWDRSPFKSEFQYWDVTLAAPDGNIFTNESFVQWRLELRRRSRFEPGRKLP